MKLFISILLFTATGFAQSIPRPAVTGSTVTSANITDATAAGRSVLTAADAAAQRTALGLGTSATTSAATYLPVTGGSSSGLNVNGVTLAGSGTLTTTITGTLGTSATNSTATYATALQGSASAAAYALPMFWYSARTFTSATNGATVNSWADRSGGGWTLSGTGIYRSGGMNGEPSVYFGSLANRTMTSGTAMFSGTYTGFTAFWVTRTPVITNTTAAPGSPTFWVGDGSYGLRNGYTARSDGTGQFNAWWGVNFLGGGGQQGYVRQIRHDNFTRPKSFGYRVTAGGTSELWIDGILTNSGTAASPLTVLTPSGALTIGNIYGISGSSFWLGVSFSEFIGYNRALTIPEVKSINKELNAQYHIAETPRIVMIGDSIAESEMATFGGSLFDILQPKITTLTLENRAIGGTTASSMATLAEPWGGLIASLRTNDICHISVGSIDIGNSVAASTVLGYLTTIVTAIHDQGAKAWVVTELPRYNSAISGTQTATEAQRILFNAGLVSGTTGADGYIDPCRSAVMGQPGQYLNNQSYYVEANGVHPTTLGYTELSNIFEAGIRSSMGLAARATVLTGTLVSGSCTITDPSLNNSSAFVTRTASGGVVGNLGVTVSGSTATVASSLATDTSTVKLNVSVGN